MSGRDRVLAALGIGERRFRSLVEAAPDAIFVQIDYRFAYLNPAALALLGAESEDQLVGAPVLDRFPPDTREVVRERIRTINDRREPVPTLEETWLRLDGSEIPVEVAAVPLEYGGANGALVFVRDRREERAAREALLASERRYRELFEGAPVGVFVTRSSGEPVSINPRMAQILGCDSVEQALGHYRDLRTQLYLHPEHRAEALQRLQREGRIEGFEFEALTVDGRTIWLTMNARLSERRSDGSFTLEGFASDITDRKRAEVELRRIEWMLSPSAAKAPERMQDQGYGDLTELNHGGLILQSVGKERLVHLVNDFLDLLGTSAAVYEKDGSYALGIFASGWCRMLDRASRALCGDVDNPTALASGSWLCHESCWSDCSKLAIERREPADVPCHGGLSLHTVPIFAGGEVVGAINFGYGDPPTDPARLVEIAGAYGLDVDTLRSEALAYASRPPYIAKRRLESTSRLIGALVERAQTEEALRRSEEGLRKAQRVAQLGSWTWHLGDDRLELSEETRRIFGLDQVEPPGGVEPLIQRVVHPDDRAAARQAAVSFRDDPHGASTVQLRVVRPDGAVRVVRIDLAEVLRNEHGDPVRLEGILQDVTERRMLEEQVRQAQKMESVGRLAGGVAHDFNNMLSVISGRVELALSKVDPDDPLHGDLREIRYAAERSAGLTRQLLAFARRQTVTPKVLDLNLVIADLLTMVRRLIGEHIEVVWVPGEDLWRTRIDPTQVQQILANMCVNARDAISETGRITISTSNISVERHLHGARPGVVPGEYVLLSVGDDGRGMGAEALEHLFEPFFTTKTVGQGTGLGLATVYGIVQQNGGHIDVSSSVGQGTTFHIYLPRHQGAQDDLAEAEPGPRITGGPETVLLVEDEPAILEMVSVMLEDLGYTVLSASTPGRAVGLALDRDRHIDLLLTDVVMPEMNGRVLADRLLTLHPDMACVFMSGYTADVVADQGVVDEGVHYLQKPFTMRDLSARVRTALEQRRARDR